MFPDQVVVPRRKREDVRLRDGRRVVGRRRRQPLLHHGGSRQLRQQLRQEVAGEVFVVLKKRIPALIPLITH